MLSKVQFAAGICFYQITRHLNKSIHLQRSWVFFFFHKHRENDVYWLESIKFQLQISLIKMRSQKSFNFESEWLTLGSKSKQWNNSWDTLYIFKFICVTVGKQLLLVTESDSWNHLGNGSNRKIQPPSPCQLPQIPPPLPYKIKLSKVSGKRK